MAKLEPDLPSRVAVLESEVKHLNDAVNSLTAVPERVAHLAGRLEERAAKTGERTAGGTLFWTRIAVVIALILGVLDLLVQLHVI